MLEVRPLVAVKLHGVVYAMTDSAVGALAPSRKPLIGLALAVAHAAIKTPMFLPGHAILTEKTTGGDM